MCHYYPNYTFLIVYEKNVLHSSVTWQTPKKIVTCWSLQNCWKNLEQISLWEFPSDVTESLHLTTTTTTTIYIYSKPWRHGTFPTKTRKLELPKSRKRFPPGTWNNHFIMDGNGETTISIHLPCRDLVHHPTDSQPIKNGCLEFFWPFLLSLQVHMDLWNALSKHLAVHRFDPGVNEPMAGFNPQAEAWPTSGGPRADQWLFLVPLKGGRWHIIPHLAVYTTYIPLIYCLLGVICYRSHLLEEPETTIDAIVINGVITAINGLKKDVQKTWVTSSPLQRSPLLLILYSTSPLRKE